VVGVIEIIDNWKNVDNAENNFVNRLRTCINMIKNANFNPYLILLPSAALIILTKLFFTTHFSTPFVFGDEYLYTIYTKEIISNPFQILYPGNSDFYAPGYSIFLLPAFFFYPDMNLVYRSIQFLNILISTSILFIAYAILNRYCNNWVAVIGSLLIASLPVSTLYSFIIFSENLYISLFTLSGLLLLKSVESNNRILHILTGLTIFFLILIKPYGFLALFAFLIVMLYLFFYFRKQNKPFLLDKLILICTPVFTIGIWYVLKTFFSNSFFRYNTNLYLETMVSAISNISNLITAFELIFHEIDYFILTGYVVFFALSISIFLYWKNLEPALQAYALYSYIYMAFSIIPTVLHMLITVYNPSSPQYLYYFIWGRYIDPAIPSIFLLGLISWSKFFTDKPPFKGWKLNELYVIIGLFSLMLVVTYPYNAIYKAVNTLSIQYTQAIITGPVFIFYILIVLFICFFLLFRKRPVVFLVIMIFFSLIASAPAYFWITTVSGKSGDRNDIGFYIHNNQIVDAQILLPNEWESFPNVHNPDHSLIKFWGMPNLLKYGNISEYSTSEVDYIISKTPLPFHLLAISSDNLMFYSTEEPSHLQMIPSNGFHLFEYENNTILRTWISNNATITIIIPESSHELTNYSLIMEGKSFYNIKNVNYYVNEEFINSFVIPTNPTLIVVPINLNRGQNTVKIFTPDGCQRPSDVMNSIDTRCLSIYYNHISIIPT